MKRRPQGLDGAALLAWMVARCVRSPSGCLEWTGHVNADGYVELGYRGRMVRGHRLAYRLRHGPIPVGKLVMHTCDNRKCIDDAHHQLGTNAENMEDMRRKGRASRKARTNGTINGCAKLTEDAVRAIRKDTRPLGLIAAEYGISKANACLVRARRTWTHLED